MGRPMLRHGSPKCVTGVWFCMPLWESIGGSVVALFLARAGSAIAKRVHLEPRGCQVREAHRDLRAALGARDRDPVGREMLPYLLGKWASQLTNAGLRMGMADYIDIVERSFAWNPEWVFASCIYPPATWYGCTWIDRYFGIWRTFKRQHRECAVFRVAVMDELVFVEDRSAAARWVKEHAQAGMYVGLCNAAAVGHTPIDFALFATKRLVWAVEVVSVEGEGEGLVVTAKLPPSSALASYVQLVKCAPTYEVMPAGILNEVQNGFVPPSGDGQASDWTLQSSSGKAAFEGLVSRLERQRR